MKRKIGRKEMGEKRTMREDRVKGRNIKRITQGPPNTSRVKKSPARMWTRAGRTSVTKETLRTSMNCSKNGLSMSGHHKGKSSEMIDLCIFIIPYSESIITN